MGAEVCQWGLLFWAPSSFSVFCALCPGDLMAPFFQLPKLHSFTHSFIRLFLFKE